MTSGRYIGQEIQVRFDAPPELTKSPTCPDAVVWEGQHFGIVECLDEWIEYGRRGRMAGNMRAERLPTAARRGSWGVGRFFFHVRLEDGRKFELYYDRAPKAATDREGSWFLRCELDD